MSYAYRELRVEPHNGIWFKWKATPISTDTPEPDSPFVGLKLELAGEYVLLHPFKFMGRTKEQAIARATKWAKRENAEEDLSMTVEIA